MLAIKAHFDGSVIVPDEPLTLLPNQRLSLTIQPIEERRTNFTEWLGLGNRPPLTTDPQFTSDLDLWE